MHLLIDEAMRTEKQLPVPDTLRTWRMTNYFAVDNQQSK